MKVRVRLVDGGAQQRRRYSRMSAWHQPAKNAANRSGWVTRKVFEMERGSATRRNIASQNAFK